MHTPSSPDAQTRLQIRHLIQSLRQALHQIDALSADLEHHVAPHHASHSPTTDIRPTATRPHAAPLPAPSLPDASSGGLGYDDLLRNPDRLITFDVGTWDGFEDGDTVYIVPEGTDIGSAYGFTLASAADRYKVVRVYIPAHRIHTPDPGGRGTDKQVGFEALVKNQLGLTVRSTVTRVRIKDTIPGGRDPNPGTPYLNEKLLPPQVAPTVIDPGTSLVTVTLLRHGNNDDGRQAPYAYMTAGDVIKLQWAVDGNSLTHVVTSAEATSGAAIIFTVNRAMIDIGGVGIGAGVTWEVSDAVGNRSFWSPPTLVDVEDPLAPRAPAVRPTVDNLGKQIDIDALAGADAHAVVSDIDTGDRIVVHVAGTPAEGAATHWQSAEYTAPADGSPLDILLPHALFPPLVQGRCAVYYERKRGTTTAISARRRLDVIGNIQALQPPTALEAVGGTINPDSLGSFVHALIPEHPLVDFGARVRVEMYGATTGGGYVREVAYLDIGSPRPPFPLSIELPAGSLRQLDQSNVTFGYGIDTYDTALGQWVSRTPQPSALYPSPTTTYAVRSASGGALRPPIIDEARDGKLDPADIPGSNVTVRIPSEGIRVGDTVKLTWRGSHTAPYETQLIARELPLHFLVPKTPYLTGNDGGTIEVSYSAPGGSSSSLVLQVGAGAVPIPTPPKPNVPDFGNKPVIVNDPLIDEHNGLRIRVPASDSLIVGWHVDMEVRRPDGNAVWTAQWDIEKTGAQPFQLLGKSQLQKFYADGVRALTILYFLTPPGGGNRAESTWRQVSLAYAQDPLPYLEDFDNAPSGYIQGGIKLNKLTINASANNIAGIGLHNEFVLTAPLNPALISGKMLHLFIQERSGTINLTYDSPGGTIKFNHAWVDRQITVRVINSRGQVIHTESLYHPNKTGTTFSFTGEDICGLEFADGGDWLVIDNLGLYA